MGIKYVFNSTTGNLDATSVETPAGSNTQIQFNDAGSFGGDVDLTWNKTTNVMTVAGDLTLDDGVAGPVTTLQTITPTQNNTISLPNATGTVALVAGSSGQLVYNNAGSNAGLTSANIGSTGQINVSLAGAASTPPVTFTGSWFTGGTATTTKPQLLIEPTGTTSTAWSTSGTGLGVNAASGFAGNLLDLQVNGTSQFKVNNSGQLSFAGNSITCGTTAFDVVANGGSALYLGTVGFVLGNRVLQFSSGAASSGGDVSLARDAAGTLAQRNGTNAQTFRVYNTYTSSTNYELGKLEWSSNVFRIGTEKGSGGGTARGLEFQVDGTTRVSIDTTGTLVIGPGTGLQIAGASGSAAKTIQSYDSAPLALNSLGNNVGIGTSSPTAVLDVNSNTLRLRTARTPASATATGNAGDICWDADYIYVCTATNTWKRAALATW